MASATGRPPVVLALEATAHGQASGWRRREDLIDALPYYDENLAPEVKAMVEAMIDEEAPRGPKRPSDYLEEMGPMPKMAFEGHPMLAAEYERVQREQPMPALDTTRYRLDAPQGAKRHDYGAWKAAVDNAHAQLEHQHLRIENLELMLKYGDKNWRTQGQLVDSLVKQFESELAETKRQITAVNQERKLSQLTAGSQLRQAEQEYYMLTKKNVEIDLACERLEREVLGLQSQVEARAAATAAAAAAAGANGAEDSEVGGPAPGADAAMADALSAARPTDSAASSATV